MKHLLLSVAVSVLAAHGAMAQGDSKSLDAQKEKARAENYTLKREVKKTSAKITQSQSQAQNKNFVVVSSLDALKAYSGTSQYLYLDDYYQGGLFKKVVRTANNNIDNGTVFASADGKSVLTRVMTTEDRINVSWFGAKPNDRSAATAFKNAMETAGRLKKYVYIPSGNYLITEELKASQGMLGIIGESKFSTRLMPAAELDPLLTVSFPGNYENFSVGDYQGNVKSRSRSNGIWFQGEKATKSAPKNAFLLARVKDIMVRGLYGYGIKCENVYDSYFSSLTVEQCGSPEQYAFQVLSTNGETTNVSTWDRLQVENSYRKAIYISPMVLSCIFSNIHAERQDDVKGDTCIYLGGNRCLYEQLRLTSLSGESAICLDAYNTIFRSFSIESANELNANAWNGGNISIYEFYMPKVMLKLRRDQVGTVNLNSGKLKESVQSNKITMLNVKTGL